ncbi:MAG: hypothetical protein AAF199_06100 [Pseudomonadota bacterium]
MLHIRCHSIATHHTYIRVCFIKLCFALASLLGAPATMAQPPVEVYGQLPLTRSMSISPNSKRVSYLSRQEDGTELAVIYDLENKAPVSAVGTLETKARSIDFAGNDFAILRLSPST